MIVPMTLNDKLLMENTFPGIGCKKHETAEKYVKFERLRRICRSVDYTCL